MKQVVANKSEGQEKILKMKQNTNQVENEKNYLYNY